MSKAPWEHGETTQSAQEKAAFKPQDNTPAKTGLVHWQKIT